MNSLWRYETKLVIKALPISEILNDIYLNPVGFRPSFRPRTVNNLYFDTHGLDCFQDHVNGYPKRFKIRIRWYGDYSKFENPVLEVKRKDGNVGSKDTYPIKAPLTFDRSMSFASLLKHTDLPVSFRETFSSLQPSLFNKYDRCYFVSANNRIRLTLDSDISYKSIGSNAWIKEHGDLKIVEFKYNQADFLDGTRALKNFHYVQEKSSKYIRGLLRIT